MENRTDYTGIAILLSVLILGFLAWHYGHHSFDGSSLARQHDLETAQKQLTEVKGALADLQQQEQNRNMAFNIQLGDLKTALTDARDDNQALRGQLALLGEKVDGFRGAVETILHPVRTQTCVVPVCRVQTCAMTDEDAAPTGAYAANASPCNHESYPVYTVQDYDREYLPPPPGCMNRN